MFTQLNFFLFDIYSDIYSVAIRAIINKNFVRLNTLYIKKLEKYDIIILDDTTVDSM